MRRTNQNARRRGEGGEENAARRQERVLAQRRREAKMFNYEEGDTDEVKAGKRIMAQGAMLFGNGLKLITEETINSELGGKEGFLRIFQRFYERAMDDPLLRVLFNESKDEKPPEVHGRILGQFFLLFLTGDRTYTTMEGTHGLNKAHQRAKNCPMREEKHRGRGFTKKQAWTWLGHLEGAMYDLGVPKGVRENLTLIVGARINRYGPFIED